MRKVNLLFVILALIALSAAAPPNNAMAGTIHAWVWGDGAGSGNPWSPTGINYGVPGATVDTLDRYSPDFGTVKAFASTSGIVKLYSGDVTSWYLEAHAQILDTYTFTNLDDPNASGLISGLYGRIDYSGTLTASRGGLGSGFSAWYGTVDFYWDSNKNSYMLVTTGQEPIPVATSEVQVSGSFIFPIYPAYWGEPLDLTWIFLASAGNGQTADFYSTSVFSFYKDGVALGASSVGGYNQGTPVPEPASLLLLGTGIGGTVLASWRRRK